MSNQTQVVEAFPMPEATIRFLGGPMDGGVMEQGPVAIEDIVYPEWFQPEDSDQRYYLLIPDELPGWVFIPIHMDMFDVVYIWGPYYWTEMGYTGAIHHE